MNKLVKETKYCKVLRQAKIRANNVAYGIEKIFVKELNQEEIRFVYFKDIIKGSIMMEEQLVAGVTFGISIFKTIIQQRKEY